MKRFNLWLFLVLTVVGIFICLAIWRQAPERSKITTHSGPVENGKGWDRSYHHTVAFSPDEQALAYIWADSTYSHPPEYEGLPCTLTEKLEVRLKSISNQFEEIHVPLNDVDLRPNGKLYFALGGLISFSRDSRYLAALCEKRIALFDSILRTNRNIEFAGESFGTLAWPETNTLCFSTCNRSATTFWRWNVNEPLENRIKLYSFENVSSDGFNQAQWSPAGRYACFRIRAATNGWSDVILDVKTGVLNQFSFSLLYQCWKSDDSALIVDDALGEPHRTVLINPATGEMQDLSKNFRKLLSGDRHITLVAPTWTPDGKKIIFYADSLKSTAVQQGYVIEPKPFKVIFSTNQIIHWSPIPGWVLLQGSMSFKWLKDDGSLTAPIQGWPNDWTWSKTGKYAAKVDSEKITIIQPALPPGVDLKQ